jgi:hypothetical protein
MTSQFITDLKKADISRREALMRAVAIAAGGLLQGCGGGAGGSSAIAELESAAGGDTAAALGAAPAAPVASPPAGGSAAAAPAPFAQPGVTPGVVTGKYRYEQTRLFQSVASATIASRLPGGLAYPWEGRGPTNVYVDMGLGWPWTRAGGDWVDADSVRHGTNPWFTVATNAVSGSTAVYTYSVDATAALGFIQTKNRWCALLLRTRGTPRVIAGLHQGTQPVPKIDVTYTDGTTATLKCLLIGAMSAGSTIPSTTAAKYNLPVVTEFERPTKAVRSATLSFTVVEHWSGSAMQVDGFVIDPPVNTAGAFTGVAASAGGLDAGLDQNAAVIGVHRYMDGTAYSDFVSTGRDPLVYNVGAERNYDPAIWGRGATDKTKFPHLDLGKWIGVGTNWNKVDSTYTGEGFQPLVAGMGAMRVRMPAEPGITDGSSIGYTGSLASNAFIFLPEPDFGLLKRIFVRYYLRLSGYAPTSAKRYQVLQGTTPTWTDMAGKTGIAPSHVTSYGGVSGTSGGGYGWQLRLSWADCDAEQGGPDEKGISLGLHTYDFQWNNPVRHGVLDTPRDMMFGQQGGLGGVIYHDKWYCIEMEVDLNTVMAGSPGYLRDGAVRMWVDGRLAFERSDMVMRSLPIITPAYSDTSLRPCRELGHRDLWFNWFHGGKTLNTIDRTVFFTGLVWSRAYIGPMKPS